MVFTLCSIALFCAFSGLVVSSEPRAQLLFAENDALLKLDYATYRGRYNSTNEVASYLPYLTFKKLTDLQVYTFRNIRYAAPPVGELRWAKPIPPPKTDVIQDRSEAIACTQPSSREVTTIDGAIVGSGQEDCLFLDLTIPRKVFENKGAKVPVLQWVHGGYYSNALLSDQNYFLLTRI
jgi:hypothetical protein